MFDRITRAVTEWTGTPTAVIGSIVMIAIWALAGPIFRFSDTWQLVINTATTILTFNMVFVIQSSQNRDGAAIQTKLDEILRALEGADDRLIAIEEDGRETIAAARRMHREVKPAADATALSQD